MAPSSAHLPGDEGDGRPLAGRTVVVTRPAAQAAALAEPLAALGATVIVAPLIEIVPTPLDDELRRVISNLAWYDLVIFTSANAVEAFVDRLREAGGESVRAGGVAPDFAHTKLAAIGPKTCAALEQRGLECALVPDAFVAEGCSLRSLRAAPLSTAVASSSRALAKPAKCSPRRCASGERRSMS